MQNEPQLSAEQRAKILLPIKITDWARNEWGLDDSDVLSAEEAYEMLESGVVHFLATALEDESFRHIALMAGLEAQIEQKAVLRASELVGEARTDERQAVIVEIEEYSYELCANCMHELRAKLVEMKEAK